MFRAIATQCFLAGALITSCLWGGAATEAAIYPSEYFTYGNTAGSLFGLGDADAEWAGSWAGFSSSSASQYSPTANLTYTAPGYNPRWNAPGAVTGGSNRGQITYRNFSSGLTGTIWISYLSALTASGGDPIFWLDTTTTGVGRDLVGVFDGVARLEYNSTITTFANVGFNTNLFLIKIDMNVGGSADTVSVWFNPDLSGGQTTLGTPTASGSGVDTFGPTLI